MSTSFSVVQPNGKCLIASTGNWVAVSPDGYSVCLLSEKFRKYFRLPERVAHLLFSPKGKTLYAVGKSGTVRKLSLVTKKLNDDLQFEVLFSIPELNRPKFLTIIPFQKAVYVIKDSVVLVVVGDSVTQIETLDVPITSCSCIPRDIALKHSIIDPSVILDSVAVVGDVTGRVSRLSFPNTLIQLESISSPFVSKSEPIAHIFVDNEHLIVAGECGTVATGVDREGTVTHPITSLHMRGEQVLFVSNQRLFIAPVESPNAFHAATKFTSRIACANGDWALTTSGAVVKLSAQNVKSADPRPQYIEYALNRLHEIGDEHQRLQKDVVESESLLDDLQLLRALKSGIKACDADLQVFTNVKPEGRVAVTAKVRIVPRDGYSCRGCSVVLVVQNNTFATETICLPKLSTPDCDWTHEISVNSPQPVSIDVVIVNVSDSVVVVSETFDIIDCSAEVSASEICVGKLSPIHSLLPLKGISSLQASLVGGQTNAALLEPKAYISATGEHWTVRIDGANCTVSAGTESTAICAMNAIFRRLDVTGSVSIGKLYETSGQIQAKAEAFSKSLEHETSLMRSTLVQKAREFQMDVQSWVDSHLR